MATYLLLVGKTTAPASADRFEKLWALLGEGVIESVWVYGYGEPDTIQATLDVLPAVFRALGIGCARYLKVNRRDSAAESHSVFILFSSSILQPLVLQLVHSLIPSLANSTSIAFQSSSARALAVLIEACAPRMHAWKGTILDGVCRCWVNLVESGADNTGNSPLHSLSGPYAMSSSSRCAPTEVRELKEALRGTCGALARACPSVTKVRRSGLASTESGLDLTSAVHFAFAR